MQFAFVKFVKTSGPRSKAPLLYKEFEMCNLSNSQKGNVISLKEKRNSKLMPRKKIWEIRGGLHCSIIGTCLTMRDLGAAAAKSGIWFPKDCTDYEIHGAFVQMVSTKNRVSIAVDKALDKKYRFAAAKTRNLQKEEELIKYWEDASKNGDIPAAYWVLLSHPYISDDLMERLFGEVHMMSHALGSARRMDVHKLQKLESECANLEGKLSLVKSVYRKRLKSRDAAIAELTSSLNSRKQVERKLSVAYDKIFEMRRTSGMDQLEGKLRELDIALQQERERADRAESRLRELDKRFEMEREVNDQAAERIRAMGEENTALEQELRSALSCLCTDKTCSDLIENEGRNLCGRKILYVGGRSSLVRHYRALVERRGGLFQYHDGGDETSMGLLKQTLGTVDTVICPIDCVSHGACRSVKQICKHMSKQFIPLRSSGLSSLARGIQAIS